MLIDEIRDWLNSQSYLPEHIDPGYTNNEIRGKKCLVGL